MTSSNANTFRVSGPWCGEFTGEFPSQRPVTWGFDVLFDLPLHKRLNKQARRRWFETPSCALWCHCNVNFSRVESRVDSLEVVCMPKLLIFWTISCMNLKEIHAPWAAISSQRGWTKIAIWVTYVRCIYPCIYDIYIYTFWKGCIYFCRFRVWIKNQCHLYLVLSLFEAERYCVYLFGLSNTSGNVWLP